MPRQQWIGRLNQSGFVIRQSQSPGVGVQAADHRRIYLDADGFARRADSRREPAREITGARADVNDHLPWLHVHQLQNIVRLLLLVPAIRLGWGRTALQQFRDHFLQLRSRNRFGRDLSLTVEQVVSRRTLRVEKLCYLPVFSVTNLWPCQRVFARRFLKSFRFLIERDANDRQPLVFVFCIKLFKQRKLPRADASPRGPEVEQRHLSLEIGQRHRLAVDPSVSEERRRLSEV